ncbi:efflux RND transporter periplasmic adaptor subunit [Planctomycetaceae bacterium]|nr:efflux RND transporter periplasmic adaptor subunit [Planctomycetaceae bacterium]MDC0261860.1 efflux RND transporter periplasmic adaptor subunit [Planctomycetaceae bacterium]
MSRVFVLFQNQFRFLLPLLMTGCFCIFSSTLFAQRGPAPVTAAPILFENVQSSQSFVGTVVPTRQAIIGSAVDGRVIEFKVNEGDRVEADGNGAVLAQLLTATVQLEIDAEKQEYEALNHEWKKLENGTRKEEIDQALALKDAALAAEVFAVSEFDRTNQLYKRGAITSREYDEAKYKLALAVNNAKERVDAHKLAVNGPREEDKEIAKARMLMQKAVVEKLEDQKKKYTIRSKFAGYVVQEFTEAGAWLNRGDPIAEVVALDEVDILVNVLESQIRHVMKGALVRVEIPSLNNPVIDGTVALIVPQADYKTRTFPVKIRVQNTTEKGVPTIKAGMLARVALPTGIKHDSYLIPKDAIVLGGRTPAVFVIDGAKKKRDEGTARLIPIKIGIAVDTFVSVEVDHLAAPGAKLEKGTLVVTRGNERLIGSPPVIVTEIDVTKPKGIADSPRQDKSVSQSAK